MTKPRMAFAGIVAGMLGAVATPQESLASSTWNGWVNGFGASEITYTVRCSNGQVITGTSTVNMDSVTCDDGSNSLSWDYGILWRKNTRSNDRKQVAQANCGFNTSGQLANGGQTFMLMGTGSGDSVFQAEIAVLSVPGSQLPHDTTPRTVEELIAGGFITAADVHFQRSYAGSFNDTYNMPIPLGGMHNESNVVVYQYGTSLTLTEVPTVSEWGMIVLGAGVLLFGAMRIYRHAG